MWYSYKEKFLSSLLLDPDPPSIPRYWFPQTSGVWWLWHSYHVDNAESTESVIGRLKTCVYHEETASTCSVSGLSRSTLQPMKLGRARSRDVTDSTAHTRHSTPRTSGVTRQRTPSSSGGTKPRYCYWQSLCVDLIWLWYIVSLEYANTVALFLQSKSEQQEMYLTGGLGTTNSPGGPSTQQCFGMLRKADYSKTLIFSVYLIFANYCKYLRKFRFTVALCGGFHCNLAAEYSSVGNTSPGSC